MEKHGTPSPEFDEKYLGWFIELLCAVLKAIPRKHFMEVMTFWRGHGDILAKELTKVLMLPLSAAALCDEQMRTRRTLQPGDTIAIDRVNHTISIGDGRGGAFRWSATLSRWDKIYFGPDGNNEPMGKSGAMAVANALGWSHGLSVILDRESEESSLFRLEASWPTE